MARAGHGLLRSARSIRDDLSKSQRAQPANASPTDVPPSTDAGELGVQVVRQVLSFTEDQDRKPTDVDGVAGAVGDRRAPMAIGVDRSPETEHDRDVHAARRTSRSRAQQLPWCRPGDVEQDGSYRSKKHW